MNSRKKIARVAGILYLAHYVTFFLADNGVHSTAVGSMDFPATAQAMMASDLLFRIGFVNYLLAALFFLLAAWALYVLLKPVNEDIALLFVLLNLGGVAIWGASLVFEFAALFLLNGADYLAAYQPEELHALALLFLNLYQYGFMISQIVLNLWLFPLGYLVFRSGFLPKVFGILLIIDGFAMMTWCFQFFFLPGAQVLSSVCLAIGFFVEGAFLLWLLIKGAKERTPALAEAG